VFFLIKLPFMLIMLPFKLLAELAEHSGRRRRYYRRHRKITWLPGQAGLARWTRRVTRQAPRAGRTPMQQYVITPLTILAVGGAWLGMIYVWLTWWMLLVIIIPLSVLA